MSRRLVRALLFAVPSLTLATNSVAIPPLPDERLEWYQVQDDALLRRIGDSTCFATHRSLLTLRSDGDYDLAVSAFTQVEGAPLCDDVPFYGQVTTGDFSGSTGTLVGQNLVLCARHAFMPDTVLSTRAFIFDYNQIGSEEPPFDLPPGSTVRVKAENVFFPVAIVAHGKVGADWTLLRLDRPAPMERVPLPLQRDGSPLVESDEVAVVGHGDRLPKKFSRAVVEPDDSAFYNYFLVGAHGRPGNSGSPAVSVESGRYHGMVVGGSVSFVPTHAGCYTYCTDCPPIMRAEPHEPRLLQNVPAISLQSDAPAAVQHFGPPGGPFTQSIADQQLSVPLTSRRVNYRITVEGGSWLEVIAEGGASGQLKPGEQLAARVRITSEALSLAPGVYHARVVFHDDVYSTRIVSRHTLNVGVGAITVSPDEPFFGDGPGAPLWSEKTYTITNHCDVPVGVNVNSGASWIHVDHLPLQHIVVPAQGRVPVVVTLFRDCDIIDDPGVYEAKVTFAADFGTETPVEVFTRQVRMDFGRWHYQNPESLPLTLGIGLNEHVIEVSDKALLEDIDVEIEGYVFPRFLDAYSVYVTSPSGTRVDLITYTNHGQFGSAPSALDGVYDDATNPPADPDGLAAFIGEQIEGKWTVTVEQSGTLGAEQGVLGRAVLRIRGPRWVQQPPCGDPGANTQQGILGLLQTLERFQTGDFDQNLDGVTTETDCGCSWSPGRRNKTSGHTVEQVRLIRPEAQLAPGAALSLHSRTPRADKPSGSILRSRGTRNHFEGYHPQPACRHRRSIE